MDEVRDVVDRTLNGHPEVVVTGVLVDFRERPCLVEVGTKEATELDDVEDDDAVEEEDEPEDRHLLPPRELDVRTLHTADFREHDRGDPPCREPYHKQPVAPRSTRGNLLDGIRSLCDNIALLRRAEVRRNAASALLVPLRTPPFTRLAVYVVSLCSPLHPIL